MGSFGYFKKLKMIPFRFGVPNPKSVSKEEWERRHKQIHGYNKQIKEKYLSNHLFN